MVLGGYSRSKSAVDPDKGPAMRAGQVGDGEAGGKLPGRDQDDWAGDLDGIPQEVLDATVEILDCLAQWPEKDEAEDTVS
ncbi:hypothetical protein [Desulfonatronum parangueonense]